MTDEETAQVAKLLTLLEENLLRKVEAQVTALLKPLSDELRLTRRAIASQGKHVGELLSVVDKCVMCTRVEGENE
jgi:hypothetical protein